MKTKLLIIFALLCGACFGQNTLAGKLTVQQTVQLTGDITPTTISSNQNDYAPTNHATAAIFYLSSDAARTITGLAGGLEGREVKLFYSGTGGLTLSSENVLSAAANRFSLPADFVMASKTGVTLVYDITALRWKISGAFDSYSPGLAATKAANLSDLADARIALQNLSGVRSVATIASLKALSVTSLTSGFTVRTSGYYAANDGGDGTYVYNSGSSATDNGGNVIQPTSGSGRWLLVNWNGSVRTFGAKGDATSGSTGTDDTTAVQAAQTYLQANPTAATYNGVGRLYFPKGAYRIASSLTIGSGIGLIWQGDGPFASTLYFNSASGAQISVSLWIGFYVRDMAFINKSATAPASQTTTLFDMTPTSGGTMCRFENVWMDNFNTHVKVEGSINGDTFMFEQVNFRNCVVGFDTLTNSQAVIHLFRNCVAGNISGGLFKGTGQGPVNFDSINAAGCKALLWLIPTASSFGYNTNYTFTNCKLEWNQTNTYWVYCYANAFADIYPGGNIEMVNCSIGGGDTTGVTATTPTLAVSGLFNVNVSGGMWGGSLLYGLSPALAGTQNAGGTFNGQVGRVTFRGVPNAPLPNNLQLVDWSGDSGAGVPYFVYEGCINVPDCAFWGARPAGASHQGYSYGRINVMRFCPGFGTIGNGATTQTSVDFAGRKVRIISIQAVLEGTTAGGTKTATAYSNSGYSAVVSSVSWTGTAATTASLINTTTPLILSPATSITKLYLELVIPSGFVIGYWNIVYETID